MVPRITLSMLQAARDRATPESRQFTLDRLQQWREADERIRKICAEKGMPYPIMVC